jgi:LAO/AO transport system kinase
MTLAAYLKVDATGLEVAAAVRRGDIRTCARLITRIEDGDPTANPILQQLYLVGGRTPIIGITGPPGAGKSTVVDQLVARYRARSLKVAVLAIDPASPFSGGAILGDRIRMARHNTDPGVFIRSMSARGMLGGTARAASDALTVLDAMGEDAILVETVGVGQSEIDIMRHARTVVIVQTPAAGDAIQALKAGILEIGDVFAINKADTPGADRAASVLREAIEFHYDPHDPDAWHPPILKTQGTDGIGIDELLEAVECHGEYLRSHPQVMRRRRLTQARIWMKELVSEELQRRCAVTMELGLTLAGLLEELVERRCDPYTAAQRLLVNVPINAR